MPIQRFHSFEAAADALWADPQDPRHWATARQVWALADRLSPRRFPAGVLKHRSIEDANRQMDAWLGLATDAVDVAD